MSNASQKCLVDGGLILRQWGRRDLRWLQLSWNSLERRRPRHPHPEGSQGGVREVV